MPIQRPQSDLIQPYIDLWESVSVGRHTGAAADADSAAARPPTPPPKPKELLQQQQQQQQHAAPMLRGRPPRLHHTGTFGHRERRRAGNDKDMVQVVGGKSAGFRALDVQLDDAVEVGAQDDRPPPAVPQAVSYTSIFATSPTYAAVFAADPNASVLELAKPDKREDVPPSEKLPFTPDELWNFHRPRTPLPPVPTAASSAPRRKSAVHQLDPVSVADFDFYGYPPFVRAPATSPRTSRSDEPLSPTSTTPLSSTGSYESAATSVSQGPCCAGADGAPVSTKAAKMLGIDPSSRIIANRVSAPASGLMAELPDRYNSHRTRSSSAPAFPAVSLQKYATVTRTPSAPTAAAKPPPPPAPSRAKTPYDAARDAKQIWNALYGDPNIDEDALSTTLVELTRGSREKLPRCKRKYKELFGEEMVVDVRAETTLHYRTTLTRLIAGPYEAEAQALKQNESTFFMDDKIVAEVLFGKNPDEIRGIKWHFEQLHGISLQEALENLYIADPAPSGSVFDTAGPSTSFGRACIRVLRADRQVETFESLSQLSDEKMMKREHRLNSDVENLYKTHPQRRVSNKYLNQDLLLELVIRRSDLYLGELCRMFQERHGIQLAELALAKDRTKMISGSYYPVSLVCPVQSIFRSPLPRNGIANTVFLFFRATRWHTYSRVRRTSRTVTRSCWRTR